MSKFSRVTVAFAAALALVPSVAISPALAVVPETPIFISRPASDQTDLYPDTIGTPGGFLVAWTRVGNAGQGNSVVAQQYTATGALRPGKSLATIDRPDITIAGRPKLLRLDDDKYVVIWKKSTWLYGGIFSLSSNRVSGVKRLHETHELLHDLVSLSNGNIGLVTTKADAANPFDIRYKVSLTILSRSLGILRRPTSVHGNGYGGFFGGIGLDYAIAAKASGGVVLRIDRTDGQLYGQAFTNAGALSGTQFRVNRTTANIGALADRGDKSVRAVKLTDGRVFVAWASLEGNPYLDGFEVRGRFLGVDGKPVGSEIHLNRSATGKQILPEVLALPNGRVLVTWGWQLHFERKTYARVVNANGTLGTERLLEDGSTAGLTIDTDTARLGDGSVVNVMGGEIAVGNRLRAEGIPKSKL